MIPLPAAWPCCIINQASGMSNLDKSEGQREVVQSFSTSVHRWVARRGSTTCSLQLRETAEFSNSFFKFSNIKTCEFLLTLCSRGHG